MRPTLALLALAAIAAPALAADDPTTAAMLRDRALQGSSAYAIVESLTTEVGPRTGGSAAEARARDWAAAKLKALGFENVHVQTFEVPRWERGIETAAVVGSNAQPLAITALGYSGATPAEGTTAPVVRFADVAALRAAAPGSLAGKIAYIDHAMARTQDGSSYGAFGEIRRAGPALAAQRGAAGFLMRSLGTGDTRMPHTGVTRWDNVTPIAAAALSVPDAQQLSRLLDRGPVTVHMTLTPRFAGTSQSGNVVGDLRGTSLAKEVIVVGGHLDSWDLGTGAIDDGAGVAITTAAAKTIMDAVRRGDVRRPKRTIRVVLFGDEERSGPLGGGTYLKGHTADRHVLAAESDFGAGRVWQVETRFGEAGKPLAADLARVLAPLGIAPGKEAAHGGTDVQAFGEAGVALVDLAQDGSRYFDLHHTADDTLDKIDRDELNQNVAAWTAMLWLAANAPDGTFGR